ncbi:MAG: hypothetical protein ACLVDB_00570 [Anaeromassilibacillus sp.]
MAYFTDTERIGADFQAGVLDIEVEHLHRRPYYPGHDSLNLRPMELESLKRNSMGRTLRVRRMRLSTPIRMALILSRCISTRSR